MRKLLAPVVVLMLMATACPSPNTNVSPNVRWAGLSRTGDELAFYFEACTAAAFSSVEIRFQVTDEDAAGTSGTLAWSFTATDPEGYDFAALRGYDLTEGLITDGQSLPLSAAGDAIEVLIEGPNIEGTVRALVPPGDIPDDDTIRMLSGRILTLDEFLTQCE